jgi:hypothetical protein
VGAASTFAAQSLSQFVIPYLPAQSSTLAGIEGGIVSPAIAAGATVLAMKFLDSSDLNSLGMAKTVLLGAGSYVAGDYVYNHILNQRAL